MSGTYRVGEGENHRIITLRPLKVHLISVIRDGSLNEDRTAAAPAGTSVRGNGTEGFALFLVQAIDPPFGVNAAIDQTCVSGYYIGTPFPCVKFFVERSLFDKGIKVSEKPSPTGAVPGRRGIHLTCLCRRHTVVRVMEIMDGKSHLFEMIRTLHPSCRFACGLHRREQ
jgi:hypothetical protein